jgi:hypothetical protein
MAVYLVCCLAALKAEKWVCLQVEPMVVYWAAQMAESLDEKTVVPMAASMVAM